MKIKKSFSLKELQNQFSTIFPGLKIEFYRTAEAGYDGPYEMLHYDLDTPVEMINPDLVDTELSIDENEKVGDFENEISKLLGINVQVFRRSKELWLQTVKTDKWTLSRQNLKGIHSLN